MKLKTLLMALGLVLSVLTFPAIAGDFLTWHSTNIQYLKGSDYELGTKQRDIISLEHANSWKYGDLFLFVDTTFPERESPTYYGELAPRVSLSNLSGASMQYGIIKDLLISTAIEQPENQKARYLYGLALDLNLPGVVFFKTNAYIRDNPDLPGETWQLTLSWKRQFQGLNMNWIFEGFADFAGEEGPAKENQLIVPRFLLDLGEVLSLKKNKLWVGTEWQYWKNKFGVEGKTESVFQAQVKWVF